MGDRGSKKFRNITVRLPLEPFRSDLTALSRVYKQYLNRCLINKIKCWVIVMHGKEEMGGKLN